MFYKSFSIGCLFIPWYLCEVQLKVIFAPPNAILECHIINPKQAQFAILMCPNDSMCFQNCHRICGPDKCAKNNISCSLYENENGKKFVFVIDAQNPANHGEWTCHYGDDKGPTVIFQYFNYTRKITKQYIPITKPTILSKPTTLSTLMKYTTTQKTIISTSKKQILLPHETDKPLLANMKSSYTILILLILAISLFINIIFLARDGLHNFLTKKSYLSSPKKENSRCLDLCVRLFCVQKVFKMRQSLKDYHTLNEVNTRAPRPISTNTFNIPSAFSNPPHSLVENRTHLCTPTYERISKFNGFNQSKSFPENHSEHNSNNILMNSDGHSETKHNSPSNTLSNECCSELIYDKVAEPSLYQIPYDNPVYSTSLVRPSKKRSKHFSILHKNRAPIVSMNNLNSKKRCISASIVGSNDYYDETLIKDVIKSRVELSKEMISQADSLLRRADNLLNK